MSWGMRAEYLGKESSRAPAAVAPKVSGVPLLHPSSPQSLWQPEHPSKAKALPQALCILPPLHNPFALVLTLENPTVVLISRRRVEPERAFGCLSLLNSNGQLTWHAVCPSKPFLVQKNKLTVKAPKIGKVIEYRKGKTGRAAKRSCRRQAAGAHRGESGVT